LFGLTAATAEMPLPLPPKPRDFFAVGGRLEEGGALIDDDVEVVDDVKDEAMIEAPSRGLLWIRELVTSTAKLTLLLLLLLLFGALLLLLLLKVLMLGLGNEFKALLILL
jgi:hypothetical protein